MMMEWYFGVWGNPNSGNRKCHLISISSICACGGLPVIGESAIICANAATECLRCLSWLRMRVLACQEHLDDYTSHGVLVELPVPATVLGRDSPPAFSNIFRAWCPLTRFHACCDRRMACADASSFACLLACLLGWHVFLDHCVGQSR